MLVSNIWNGCLDVVSVFMIEWNVVLWLMVVSWTLKRKHLNLRVLSKKKKVFARKVLDYTKTGLLEDEI